MIGVPPAGVVDACIGRHPAARVLFIEPAAADSGDAPVSPDPAVSPLSCGTVLTALPERLCGRPRLLDPWTVELTRADGGRLTRTAARLLIATGAAAVLPELPGLANVSWHTPASLASIERPPRRLLVLGGGQAGCGLALAFARRGSAVTLLERRPRLLPRADEDTARHERGRLEAAGVRVCTRAYALRVTAAGAGGCVRVQDEHGRHDVEFDALVVAVRRRPRLTRMGLESLGYDTARPLEVDGRWRTRLPSILACGEVAEGPPPGSVSRPW